MNRKQRRAARTSMLPSGARPSAGDLVRQLLAEAAQHERGRRFDQAARTYRRLLALEPAHAEALNNLACILRVQRKLGEASSYFAAALALRPQLYERFVAVAATLVSVLPPLAEALQRANAAWPRLLAADELFNAEGRAAVESDPLLLNVIRSIPVRDRGFERLLTALRAMLLAESLAEEPVSTARLAFAGALAQQCFINEYVFATTPVEDAQVAELSARAELAPMQVAALGMYRPLYSLAQAPHLLTREFPPAIAAVITQQLREPAEEQALRDSMPRLTPIDDDVSRTVRAQYEENPYPRWVHVSQGVEPTTLDLHLRTFFPTAAFTPLNKSEPLDVLIAGCGTGQAIAMANYFKDTRVLGVDLSLASLAYGKRKTPPELRHRIEFAQADILKLGSIGRSFDYVDSTGVLHHMAEPLEAWRILLGLVRPGGFMQVGFYSELGRADIVATRTFIADRGYGSTPAEIRRFRQDVLTSPYARIAARSDYFSTSECRDLVFHVRENRLTIPEIKSFIVAHDLKFLGFEFDLAEHQHYRAEFAQAGWSTSDLDRWHEFETRHPDTFNNMYRVWIQKP